MRVSNLSLRQLTPCSISTLARTDSLAADIPKPASCRARPGASLLLLEATRPATGADGMSRLTTADSQDNERPKSDAVPAAGPAGWNRRLMAALTTTPDGDVGQVKALPRTGLAPVLSSLPPGCWARISTPFACIPKNRSLPSTSPW